MQLENSTPFEKYSVLSNYTKMFGGTYPKFLRLMELMKSLNQMASKNSNTFTYNGEMFVSKLTPSEINKIQNCLDLGTYNSSIEMIKYIYVDIADRSF
tara:strand:+ start:139 stop:432 length:294 start_codon:yes stop_codon:yes gene_type:complete